MIHTHTSALTACANIGLKVGKILYILNFYQLYYPCRPLSIKPFSPLRQCSLSYMQKKSTPIRLPATIPWYRTLEAVLIQTTRRAVSERLLNVRQGPSFIVQTHIIQGHNQINSGFTWRKVRSNITPEFQKACIVIGVKRLRVWAYDNPIAAPIDDRTCNQNLGCYTVQILFWFQ